MRDLAMHILDLAQNSIEAEASRVEVHITEEIQADRLTIMVKDNGRGMGAEQIAAVRDPFVTSRTTRRVGLGIPLMEMTTQRCAGSLSIESNLGQGTVIISVLRLKHMDRPPMGDIENTIMGLIVANPEIEVFFSYRVDDDAFVLDSATIKSALDGLSLSHPAVLQWLQGYIDEGLRNLRGGAISEDGRRFEATAGTVAGPDRTA